MKHVSLLNKKPAKGKKVKLHTKSNSILAMEFNTRKIVLARDEMLVEFRRHSTREVWFEVWKKPDDAQFDHPGMEKTIFLDGRLSDNGGSFVTVDADKGGQVGYQLGLVAVPTITQEKAVVVGTDGTQTEQVVKEHVRFDVVETREWVGIDGTQTYINEHDMSFKQIAQAAMMDFIKMIQNMMKMNIVGMIVVALALLISGYINYQIADKAGLIDGFRMGG